MNTVIEFFSEYKIISVIVHVLSVVVGMGAAFVSDILFNIYIKDKRIQPNEDRTLGTLSGIVWVSLIFIVLSGFALFLSDPIGYSQSHKFLVKMTIVGVIIVNGYLFWKVIHPALKKIDFIDTNMSHKYVKLRKVAFALGAVSLFSWLSAFVLGMLSNVSIYYSEAIIGYAAICFGAILASQVVEHRMTHGRVEIKDK